MTKIDKDTYIEFLKKLEEANIPENLKFMLRNSWYGDTFIVTDDGQERYLTMRF